MPSQTPLISLVTATLGRSDELRRLIESLQKQTFSGFELIIVDQNADSRVAGILDALSLGFPVHHMRTEPRGVCHARNEGAAAAKGGWLLFPDDDCWYPEDYLENAVALMSQSGADIVAGRAVNADGKTIMGKFPENPVPIDRQTIWTTLIEWMTLIRTSTFRKAGGFDPQMGPGANSPWGGYEIQDLILRCLTIGATGTYSPALFGYHPEDRSSDITPSHIAKMRAYSQGKGYVMHRHGFPLAELLPEIIRPMLGMIVYAVLGRLPMARRSLAIWQGRLYGWRAVKPQ